jgi:glycosyltransferase involved in cell wall biosynthesis
LPEVLLVAGRDPRDEFGGGHSSYVRAHACAAIRAGYTPHLFCVGSETSVGETDYGVIHREASPARPFRQIMIARHAGPLRRAVESYAGTASPRVVHGFGVWSVAAVMARDGLRSRGVRARALVSSYTTYSAESRSRLKGLTRSHGALAQLVYRAEHAWSMLGVEPWERRAYLGADLVLVNYESVRRLIEARYGPGLRCRRVGYGTEASFTREREPLPPALPSVLDGLEPANAPLIVCVSRHDPRKGIDVLLAALACLRERSVPFRACLIGEGPLLEQNRQFASRFPLGRSTTIAGFVADAWDVLRRADVYVLPSRSEQSGSMALLEALQAGVAPVASSCDGIPEDVTDGDNALLFTPGDPAALADALSRVLGDTPLRRRLAARARATFEARFSPEAFSRDLGAVYREMEGPSEGPR